MKREFLGWDEPFLWCVADYLCRHFRTPTSLDLRDAILVFPIGRAGRRLLELLVLQAEADKLALIPPQIITSGALPELFYKQQKPLANESQRLLAWVQALKQEPQLKKLYANPPQEDELLGWCALAGKVDALYLELAAQHLDFAAVAKQSESIPALSSERWLILQQVLQRYLTHLATLNLSDLQQARFEALEEKRCQIDKQLFLVCLSDLNLLTREMLLQSQAQICALINAPAEMSAFFEDDGGLKSEKWAGREIEIDSQQIRFVQDFEQQAALALAQVEAWKKQYGSEQISLAATHINLETNLLQAFAGSDLKLHAAGGKSVRESTPIRVLESLAAYLKSQSFHEFGNFVRQPVIKHWLEKTLKQKQPELLASTDVLYLLDRYHDRHLPAVFRLETQPLEVNDPLWAELSSTIGLLLSNFTHGAKPISAWNKPITEFLLSVLEQGELSLENSEQHELIEICEMISQQLWDLSHVSQDNSRYSAADLISLLLSRLADSRLRAEAGKESIELLGWLELQLDDAAALLVSGMNEGYVPGSITQDEFLPDALRSKLGLTDNLKRLARDKFALSSILQSGRHVLLCALMRDPDGSALMPSRLLLSISGNELAQRVNAFYQGLDEQLSSSPEANKATDLEIAPKPPAGAEVPAILSVTQFRSYLECPYRFYLRHVLKLKRLNDCKLELDAPAFGELAHQILNDFADSNLKDSQQTQKIAAFVLSQADKHFATRYGLAAEPAVLLQFEQLKQRLLAFAKVQAEWASQGWIIKQHEYRLDPRKTELQLPDGRQVMLSGRIDRIDYNQHSKRWTIIDYKTGEKAKSPQEAHYSKSKGWVDLQLPLYHFLLRHAGVVGSAAQAAYFLLPADLTSCEIKLAEWTEEQIAEALEVAKQCAANILDGKFWPPSQVKWGQDDFALICEMAPEFGIGI